MQALEKLILLRTPNPRNYLKGFKSYPSITKPHNHNPYGKESLGMQQTMSFQRETVPVMAMKSVDF